MKNFKQALSFAILALVAISCSKSETLHDALDQNEIRFSETQMGNTVISKAVADAADSFGVYAYLTTPPATSYFENIKLSSTGNVWGLSEKYYYPAGDFTMKFFAYGNTHGHNYVPTSVSDAGLVYTDFSVDGIELVKAENFLITKQATEVSKASAANPIQLNFIHALSKIKFNANLVDGAGFENVVAQVTDITINTSNTGSLTYAGITDLWVPNATKADKTIGLLAAANKLTTATTAITSDFYVIPLAATGSNQITITVKLFHAFADGSATEVIIAESVVNIEATPAQLAINNSVTYNLKINRSNVGGLLEIKFDAPTIEDWTSTTPNPDAEIVVG